MRRAVLGLLRQQLKDKGLDLLRKVRAEATQRFGGGLGVHARNHERGFVLEDRFAGEHLVEQAAQGVRAYRSVRRSTGPPHDLLGGHVLPAAEPFTGRGVRSEEAIAMRLAGVPRSAADRMATAVTSHEDGARTGPAQARTRLAALPLSGWQAALSPKGTAYQRVWQILDGVQ